MKTFPTLIRILLFFFLTASSCFGAEQVQFRILHLNDFHGFAEPQRLSGSAQTAGGLSFLAGSINQFRKHQPTLLLAAGDFIQGHPWTNLFEGKSTIEAMNVMGFSAMVLGNHEFDFGQDVLKKRIAEAAFPVLAANVRGFPSVKPYVIKDISGLKVGIIGLITEETSTTTHPKNVEGLIFSPVIDTAQQLVRELRNKTDLIIILSHLGLPADVALAGAVEGIDIIVGGHSHTRVEKPMIVRNTLIVQAWEHGKVLGVLDVTVRNKKISGHEGRLIVIDPVQNKPDPPVAQIV
ncbi:MAG TPA: bifunctional UDP-sugar hydrolase/5'-nucleotidase, partial [Smithella sp.]|nr:bifunctional UDP-sugar hydrolase/5'-nucleotidase [Smithella sp.]